MAKAPVSNDQDPGTETDIPDVDAKLNALDDDLNPIDPSNDPVDEPKDDLADDPKDNEDEEPKDDNPESEDSDEPKDGDSEGYTIDEGIEETEPKTPPEVTPEDQYILDNIKDSAITVRGTVGDSKEVKEFKVLAPQQLPRGFHFVDDYDASVAATAFNSLESKASQLQNQYRQEQAQKSAEEVTEKEKQTDRSDIARLQKDGVIDRFKVAPDDPSFESDSAVELVQSVLDFKDKLNSQYNEAYSKGAAYRHIGFEEAYYRYQRENPTKGNPKQTKEDQERQDFARRTSRPSPGRNKPSTPKVPAGASSRDLDRFIESLDI